MDPRSSGSSSRAAGRGERDALLFELAGLLADRLVRREDDLEHLPLLLVEAVLLEKPELAQKIVDLLVGVDLGLRDGPERLLHRGDVRVQLLDALFQEEDLARRPSRPRGALPLRGRELRD